MVVEEDGVEGELVAGEHVVVVRGVVVFLSEQGGAEGGLRELVKGVLVGLEDSTGHVELQFASHLVVGGVRGAPVVGLDHAFVLARGILEWVFLVIRFD